MGLVNPTEVHPAVMRALYRLCVQLGDGASATSEEYVGLLAPASAITGANPRLVATRTVRAAEELGVLVPANGKQTVALGLPAPPPDASEEDVDRCFVRALRNLVMRRDNNSPLFGEADTKQDDAPRERGETLATTQSREFTRIQSWMLFRDPTGASVLWSSTDARRSVQSLQRHYDGRDLVVNGNRWTNFRRWSSYLGFSRQTNDGGLLPDPTPAVVDELTDLRDGADELPLVDVRARLAERLPVLDGGVYRDEVRGHVTADEPDRALSPALAFALLRCEHAGLVTLTARADFGERALQVGARSVTHVVFAEAA
jgi:hypothetical protein